MEDDYDYDYDYEEEEVPDFQLINPLISMIQERFNVQQQENVNETWDYNIFTKERIIPNELVEAASVIDEIHTSFDKIAVAKHFIAKIPKNLKTSEIRQLHDQLIASMGLRLEVIKSLEIQINALKAFWLPKNIKELFFGAYQKVRYPSTTTNFCINENCSVCQEKFSFNDPMHSPITFVRRCTFNPLLRNRCDGNHCTCSNSNICLGCALSHLHKNAILEGKSSVYCPACRGEFCIYDFQEIKI